MVAQNIANVEEGCWLVGANEPQDLQFEHYLYQALDDAPQNANPYRYDPPEMRDRPTVLMSFRQFQNLFLVIEHPPRRRRLFEGVNFSEMTFQEFREWASNQRVDLGIEG